MEVLTTSEMEHADRLTITAGTPGFALMLSAGQAVAEAAMDLAEEGPIVVVAGRGNNGGDGFVAAAELAARGREVSVILLCERDSLQGDAASAARGWKFPVLPFNPQAIGKPALIIDALFGAGLNRLVKGEPHEMIEAINANGAPVLAVDLPSGINGTTGAVMGVAVRAAETVTFFRRKPAHLLLPGRIHCGRVRVADIGIDRSVLAEIKPQTFENVPGTWGASFPVPQADGHKYARGHAVIVSGDIASTGAARLAARGALRAGAGLATLASPRDALAVNAAALTAVMVRAVDTRDRVRRTDRRQAPQRLRDRSGRRHRRAHPRFRSHRAVGQQASGAGCRCADELCRRAGAPVRVRSRRRRITQVVLTPHEGEFPRLFSDISNKHPLRSKLERVRDAAERSGAVVLLKGPDTVVASPDGRATIAANAPPWLATAGAGDVLAGMIAGLLAQGVPAFEAASIGVWMHGEGAREAGPGLIAEDLSEVLPAVFRRLYDEFGIDY